MSTQFDGVIFSKRLQEIRKISGYKTQKEFADDIGISTQAINYYESGKRLPDARTLVLLSSFFNCSIDWLLGRSNVKNNEYDDASKKYGLSEGALEYLEDKYSQDKSNSLTLTINTLLENEYLLRLMARYLYYNFDDTNNNGFKFIFGSGPNDDIVERCMLFTTVYRYAAPDDAAKWSNDKKANIDDPLGSKELFDNATYKRLLLIEIQSELEKLLAEEDKKQHFKS